MFNLSKQVRSSLLLVLALGLVPVTIDACSGGGGDKPKDKFEIITMIGLVSAMTLAGRRSSKPLAAQPA